MQPHPAAKMFPILEGEDFAALVEDIREHGLREPIVLHDGMILDGRNRWRACQELGIEPNIWPWDGNGTPETYVVSKNLHRRHLTTRQRAAIAAELANMEKGGTGANQYKRADGSNDLSAKISNSEAAKMLNVSEASVKRAKKTMHSDPEVHEKAKAGTAPKKKNSAGNKIVLPDGVTPEELCRRALDLEARGLSGKQAAEEVGLPKTSYAVMRKIVALSIRDDLSEQDRAVVGAAVQEMNETKQYSSAAKMVAPIAERIWGKKATWGLSKTECRRMKNFERAYAFVVDACLNAPDIEIPHLAADRAKEILAEVRKAETSLRTFRQRITEYADA